MVCRYFKKKDKNRRSFYAIQLSYLNLNFKFNQFEIKMKRRIEEDNPYLNSEIKETTNSNQVV